jgi:putative endonuclease
MSWRAEQSGVESPFVLIRSNILAHMNSDRGYYVYMITSNLEKRIHEHKEHLLPGFSSTYNTTRLVYFERFSDIRSAIGRETQLKRWRRDKKEWLIQQMNPNWTDLAEHWGEQFLPNPSKT